MLFHPIHCYSSFRQAPQAALLVNLFITVGPSYYSLPALLLNKDLITNNHSKKSISCKTGLQPIAMHVVTTTNHKMSIANFNAISPPFFFTFFFYIYSFYIQEMDLAIDVTSSCRVRVLLVPVSPIKKSTFFKYVELVKTFHLVRLGDVTPDLKKGANGMCAWMSFMQNGCVTYPFFFSLIYSHV